MNAPILITGVSGSGKSTIAEAVAEEIGGTYLDADEFHPKANVEKMAQGIPLTDADRFPWLKRLVEEIQKTEHQPPVILACSLLKEKYREVFRIACPHVRVVSLKGDFDLIMKRMETRENHFMKPEMLKSQFAALEEPTDAIVIDINQPTGKVVSEIANALRDPGHP